MNRPAVFLGIALLAGCQPSEPPPAADPPPAPTSGEIDFARWPTATDKPYFVADVIAVYCRAPDPDRVAPGQSPPTPDSHGPHGRRSIVVRTNPEALAAFKARTAPMPVGTTVVKEKFAPDADRSDEYGAMVKREPGYDPEHGDWEYVFVTLQPEKKVSRGKLESCVNCHRIAKDRDYLFRNYLPAAK